MKKIITISVLFIILAGIAGGVWYFGPGDNQPQVQAPDPLLLTIINNNVQVKLQASTQFIEISTKTADVREGDTVKTSATGRAVIESENTATVAVDKNTELTLVSAAPNKSALFLGLGNLWASVQKVFGQGEYYQIQTANAVATVRGTSFSVSYTHLLTVVMVVEGKVGLQSVDPVTRQPIGTEIMISAGEKGSVATGHAPVLQTLSVADKRSEWYLQNNPVAAAPTSPAPATASPIKLAPDRKY